MFLFEMAQFRVMQYVKGGTRFNITCTETFESSAMTEKNILPDKIKLWKKYLILKLTKFDRNILMFKDILKQDTTAILPSHLAVYNLL
jgi:hypothetical protein